MSAERLARRITPGGTCVRWSPDSKRLLIGRHARTSLEVVELDGTRVRSHDEQRSFFGPGRVAWSPDGLLAATSRPDEITIWDTSSDQKINQWRTHYGALCWLTDGKHVAHRSERSIQVRNVTTAEITAAWDLGTVPFDVAASPLGDKLAVATFDRRVLVCDLTTRAISEVGRHASHVRVVSWSPDGTRLASAGGEDFVIQIRNLASGNVIECHGHGERVHAIAWSPGGRYIASASFTDGVRIWETRTGNEVSSLADPAQQFTRDVSFSPDARWLASADPNAINIWDLTGLRDDVGDRSDPTSVYIARQLATVGRRVGGGPPDLWVPRLKGAEGDCLGTIDAEGGLLAILPDGKRLVSTGLTTPVLCWDLETGETLWRRDDDRNSVKWGLACSSDGRLASLRRDGLLEVFRATDGVIEWSVTAHAPDGVGVCWSPDGTRIATCGWEDSSVRVWDGASGEFGWVYTGGTTFRGGIAWSQDERIAVVAQDQSVHVLDARSGQPIQLLKGHAGTAWRVVWIPGTSLFASSATDGTLKLWDPSLPDAIGEFPKSDDGYYGGVAASPDGRHIATVDNHKTRVFEVASGQKVLEFIGGGATVRWSPSGAFIATSQYADAPIHLWDTRAVVTTKWMATPSVAPTPVPDALRQMPTALAHLHRAGIWPPLSLLVNLLALLSGQQLDPSSPLSGLSAHPRLRALRALRWPLRARVGLAGLIAYGLPLDQWRPPEDLGPIALRDVLDEALAASHATAIESSAIASAQVMQRLDAIDDRTIALLEMLGPDVVGTDAGVAVRLVNRVRKFAVWPDSGRHLLGLRLPPRSTGRTHGSSGGGDERGGVVLTGDWDTLLSSQWALPSLLRAYRRYRGELLFRGHIGAEPPRARPVVLVLDVSPAVFGPVEQVTRLAAFWVARDVRRSGHRVMLVTSGGQEQIRELESPRDWVELWASRTLDAAAAGRSLSLARVVRDGLSDEAIILVLSHTWYGSDEPLPTLKGLRGLFVQYPGRDVRPALAAQCERWESVDAGKTDAAAERIARLLG